PKLIAACHVLHRLFLPRHPPCALSSLTIELTPRRSHLYVLPPYANLTFKIRKDYSKDTQLTNLLASRTRTRYEPGADPRAKVLLSLVIYLPNRFRCQTSRHKPESSCLPSGKIETRPESTHDSKSRPKINL